MKKGKKILYLILFFLIVGVCAGGYYYRTQMQSQKKTDQELAQKQAQEYFEGVWEDVFRNYQKTKTSLPAKGSFEFRIALNATGDLDDLTSKIRESGINAFGSGFQSLVFKFKGKYDFEDIKKSYIASVFKVYFNNTQETGTGDLDLVFKVSSDGKVVYSINSLDRILLRNFGLEGGLAEDLYQVFGESKGKQFTYQISQGIMDEIINSIQASSKDSPLYQNTQEQETKIIDAFLEDKVWNILTGSKSSDGTDVLVGEFNTDNFINFMNSVSKIISTGDINKNFDGDKSVLSQFTLGGKLWVKDNKIVDSKFATEIPMKSTNKGNGEEDIRLLILDSDFKMADPANFDIDFSNTVYRKDNPDNKITLSITGLIK